MNATPKKTIHDAADALTDKARDAGKAALRATEDGATAAKRAAEDLADGARDAAEDGQSRMGDMLRKVTDTAQDSKDAILAGASSTLSAVRDVAVEKADSARESLSDVGDRLAATLNRASAEGQDDALKSRVLGSVAQGLSSASDALRQRSVADLTSDVKVLAKRHPGAFMAAAAVAGFALARFVRASAQRRHDQGPRV
ncbi:MAG: hypothetical protein JNN06_05580 [Gemmobacter sp.]|uniref:hypothetical protein n=1 Tax=Gemmobacter sp. TaxID=1898957 RepID=UPI001A5F5711|nr:hypothetical protein [Gemmobacter sp.]MBL8561733.1 hypothetical protein [Gemmobacter sp.]